MSFSLVSLFTRFCLFIACLFYFSGCTAATGMKGDLVKQHQIQGQIKSFQVDTLDNVAVGIEGTDIFTTTNQDGLYAIDGLEPGTYSLAFVVDGVKIGSKTLMIQATEDEVIMLDDIILESSDNDAISSDWRVVDYEITWFQVDS